MLQRPGGGVALVKVRKSSWTNGHRNIRCDKVYKLLSKAISIKETIFLALGCVDHDIYVFCEGKSDEINVVYERNAGEGYGLITPQ